MNSLISSSPNQRSPKYSMDHIDYAKEASVAAAQTYLSSWDQQVGPFNPSSQIKSPPRLKRPPIPASLSAIISPPRKGMLLSGTCLESSAALFKTKTPRILGPLPQSGSGHHDPALDVKTVPPRSDVYQGSLRQRQPHLNTWLKSYENEISEDSFTSVIVYAELRMRETIERTSSLSRPNLERCAVACDMLFKITNLFGRYSSLMRLIADELVCSIYSTFKERTTGEAAPTKGEFALATPYFDLCGQAKTEAMHYQKELEKTLETEGASSIKVVTKCIASMTNQGQRSLLHITFSAWQGYRKRVALQINQMVRRSARRTALAWFRFQREGAPPDIKAMESELQQLRATNELLVKEAAELQRVMLESSEQNVALQRDQDKLALLDDALHKTSVDVETQTGDELKSVEISVQTDATLEFPLSRVASIGGLNARSSMLHRSTSRGRMSAISLPTNLMRRRSTFSLVSSSSTSVSSTSFSRDKGEEEEEEDVPKGLDALIGKQKKGEKKPKEIPVQFANAMIVSIYEAKLKQDQDDLLGDRPHQPLPELIRDFLIRKYGIKRLATNAMKSLVVLCKKIGDSTARLRLFSTLCAIPTEKDGNDIYSTVKVSLFSTLLSQLFKTPKDLSGAMGSKQQGIDRDVVITAFATTFMTMRKRNAPEYKSAAKALLTLPAEKVIKLIEGCTVPMTLVNVDDALEVMMGVWEVEHKYKSASYFSSSNLVSMRGSSLGGGLGGGLGDGLGDGGDETALDSTLVEGGHGSGTPTKRQSALLSNLMQNFKLKQQQTKQLRAERLEEAFKEHESAVNTTTTMESSEDALLNGELTIADFQALLTKMGFDLDSRQELDLFNCWEDECEQEEEMSIDEEESEETAGSLDRDGRAKAFSRTMLMQGLFIDDAGCIQQPPPRASQALMRHASLAYS